MSPFRSCICEELIDSLVVPPKSAKFNFLDRLPTYDVSADGWARKVGKLQTVAATVRRCTSSTKRVEATIANNEGTVDGGR